MIAKTSEEKEHLRASGRALHEVLVLLGAHAVPGARGDELDALALREIRARGGEPTFLGYQNDDTEPPYPATLCLSVNDVAVHGIPTADIVLAEGDIVSFDLGVTYAGAITDSAVTVIVGKGSDDAKRLLRGTREALDAGIKAARVGGHIGNIGAAVAAVARKYQLTVIRDLGGHGTGRELHEDPFIANFGREGDGEVLAAGQVLAIEPILTLGTGGILLAKDGWAYVTRDHALAAHFEHTILIGEHRTEILTA